MPGTLFLHIQAQPGSAARVIPLQGMVVRVGRSTSCDVQLDVPGLAEVHCRFRRRGAGWTVEPAGPKTQVLVNRCAIEQAVPVTDGSRVQLGSVGLSLHAVVNQRTPALGSFETPLTVERHAIAADESAEIASPEAHVLATRTEPIPLSAAGNEAETERLARWQASLEFRERWLESRREELRWEQRWRAASERLRARGTTPTTVVRSAPAEPGQSRARTTHGPHRVDLARPASLERPGPSFSTPPASATRPTLPSERLTHRLPLASPPIPPVEPPRVHWAEAPRTPLLDPEEQAARIAWETSSPSVQPVMLPSEESSVEEVAPGLEFEPDPLADDMDPTGATPPALERPLIESDFAFEPDVLLLDWNAIAANPADVEAVANAANESGATSAGTVETPESEESLAETAIARTSSPSDAQVPIEAPPPPPIPIRVSGMASPQSVVAAPVRLPEASSGSTTHTSYAAVETAAAALAGPELGVTPVPARAITDQVPPASPAMVAPETESLPRVPLDRAVAGVGWPSAREILEAHRAQQARASGSHAERTPEHQRRRRPVPTAVQAPESWTLPAALAVPPALALAVLVGGLGLALASLWMQDQNAAAAVSDRLLAGQSLPSQGLDGPALPRPSWWASTADHLYQQAAAIGPTDDPTRAEEARFLLGLAATASPLHPGVRYTAARMRPESATDATDLNLSRDIVPLALAARHRFAAGDRERALIHYREALDLAVRSNPADAAEPRKDPGSRDGRLLLPNEDLIGPIVRELAAHPGWTYGDWSTAIPDHGVAQLATYRALRDRNDPAADQVLDRLIQSTPESIEGSPWPAVERAARAEAHAERRQWREAESFYRAALASTSCARLRHALWLNLAEIAGRLNDLDARRAALDRAWNETETEIQVEPPAGESSAREPAP